MQVVHAHGYAGASVRDITQAAGVPQGSFTNHFASKEAFGLEIIDLYFLETRKTIAATLCNDTLPPLERFGAFLDGSVARAKKNEMRNGCLFGNFAAEASDHSELIRDRLVAIFSEIQAAITYCLKAAVSENEIPQSTDCDSLASFMVAALQGAQLMTKVQRNSAPLEHLRPIFFSLLLQ